MEHVDTTIKAFLATGQFDFLVCLSRFATNPLENWTSLLVISPNQFKFRYCTSVHT